VSADSPIAEAQARQLAANIISHLPAALHALSVPTKGAAFFGRTQQGCGRGLGFQGFGLYRLADVARLYLLRIPTFARKTRLFLEWNWAMFFPPDIHTGYRRTQRRSTLSQTVPDTRAPAGQGARS